MRDRDQSNFKAFKNRLASFISSRQSTPFSFPPWYAAAVIPYSRRIFSMSAKTGIFTFCFFSRICFRPDLAVEAMLLFLDTSASRFFLYWTNEVIIWSNSSCCDLRSATSPGFKFLFRSSLETCILFNHWNSSCGPDSSFQSVSLCAAKDNDTSATMYEFLLVTSSGVIASTWSSMKL